MGSLGGDPMRMRVFCAALGCLALLAPGSAYAADTGAWGGATALRGEVAGQVLDSGRYVVTNDGTGEMTDGDHEPPLSVLGGQTLMSGGVLAQDAGTTDDGTSAACAGLAGEGATMAGIGSDRCIEPDGLLTLDLATL